MMVISRDVGRELCPSDAALKDRERRGKSLVPGPARGLRSVLNLRSAKLGSGAQPLSASSKKRKRKPSKGHEAADLRQEGDGMGGGCSCRQLGSRVVRVAHAAHACPSP